MEVSVIIPARNAEATLVETLESLQTQTFRSWEAVVVDDGSTDETAKIASRFSARDPRIRLTVQPVSGGESAARNTGIKLARFDWLLFLDSDDWVLQAHLERLTGMVARNPQWDAVHCGWVRVAPDGRFSEERYGQDREDLFDELTRYCTFAIHACLVKRALVESVGGFDTSLRTCADWDLWQRIARVGARFGRVSEVLACYRMRPDSAGMNPSQILADGLVVIDRGHSSDSRVPNPHPAHVDGAPKNRRSGAKLAFACWSVGLVLGNGGDPRFLLDAVRDEREPDLDPDVVAVQLFESCLLPQCRTLDEWPSFWPILQDRLEQFLTALESQAMAPRLAERARRSLEDLVVKRARLAGNGSGRPGESNETATDRWAEAGQEKLVSVVMIFLNAEKFIHEAIESVLAQSYERWELLLVDDGSTDASKEIALRYARRFPRRIRYLEHPHRENRGIGASRNLAIGEARGEYIAFLDADDVWFPDTLARQIRIMQAQPNAGMVYGSTLWWYSWDGASDSARLDFVDFAEGRGASADTLFDPPALLILFLRDGGAVPCMCSVLTRARVVKEIRGFDESFRALYEDQAFYAKLCVNAPVFVSSECWGKYRQHPDSCCAVADRQSQHRSARLFFLKWLATYLAQQDTTNAELSSALENALVESESQLEQERHNWWWIARERERTIQEQKGWIGELQSAKAWWEEQSGNWERVARERERTIEEQKRWIAELEKARAWWEEQSGNWQRRAEERDRGDNSAAHAFGTIRLGSLRRVTPISENWGYDRGLPIDRYYIENFLARHANDIRGHVLETGDDLYTRRFGGPRVVSNDVLDVAHGNPQATIVADLSCADHIPSDAFDCVILTQTLHLIYDVSAAIKSLHRILKPNGVLLATLPGITRISWREWPGSWFWSFTSMSARRLFSEVFPGGNIQINAHGNVLVAAAFLYGLAVHEIRRDELDYCDPEYELLLTVRAEKEGIFIDRAALHR